MSTLTRSQLIAVGCTKFARNASALVDSLFLPGGTASGLFKPRKHSVLFSKATGEPFACLIANAGQSQFFVSCSMVPQSNGKEALVYMYGLNDSDRKSLGLAGLTYLQESDEAARIWSECSA